MAYFGQGRRFEIRRRGVPLAARRCNRPNHPGLGADNLQAANRTVREEMERGVFDIDSVKKANEQLIATINDSDGITTR